MNRFRQELSACMQDVQEAGGNISATFHYRPGFIGFHGHFPERPVLPGICMIQSAMVLYETVRQRRLRLLNVAAAKFLDAVGPDDLCLAELSESARPDGTARLTVRFSRQDMLVASLKLVVGQWEAGQ